MLLSVGRRQSLSGEFDGGALDDTDEADEDEDAAVVEMEGCCLLYVAPRGALTGDVLFEPAAAAWF
jgi:hypothetical protein